MQDTIPLIINNPVAAAAKDAVEKSFNVSPDSIYGLLLGLLVLLILVLLFFLVRLFLINEKKDNEYAGKLVELNVSNIETLKDLSGILEHVKASIVDRTDIVLTQIDNAREHIEQKIDILSTNIHQPKP